MDLSLSDEQEFLREAARGALARVKTVEAAREALEGTPLPDLWPLAVEAGWPGLLVSEAYGGAGLGVFEAQLVLEEAGRVLAGVPIISHLQATTVLNDSQHEAIEAFASGDERVAFVAASPPSDVDDAWTIEPASGAERAPLVAAAVDGTSATLTGTAHWVLDAPGADRFLVPAQDASGALFAVLVQAGDVTVETTTRYDSTRSLGHVTFDGAPGDVLDVSLSDVERAWYLGQVLLAAEALGTVETILEMALAYAKERFTFGRQIGSYQAVKHGLVEVLRNRENTRSLLYWSGWAAADAPEEFALAASSARVAAGKALDHAARQNIATHGGIGATWEHDAPLYFRRAQLTRRLLGGTGGAADRVAGELFAAA